MTVPVIVVHGGSGYQVHEEYKEDYIGVCDAAKKGYEILQSGDGHAVSAVVQAVRTLEDNEIFNAGRGSKLNRDGEIQMDAMVMNGQNLRCGGVVAVTNITNPVCLAEEVMKRTKHCLLTSRYAQDFARSIGFPIVPMEELVTPRAKRLFDAAKNKENAVNQEKLLGGEDSECKDTVGAVALDRHGNLACATSTGGLTFSLPGRVGDSALPGSGGYADNQLGACSTTGIGEAIMQVNMATRAIYYLEQGQSSREASKNAVQYMVDRTSPADGVGCLGGIILVDKMGDIGMYCSHDYMSFASIKDGRIKYGLHPDHSESKPL